MRSSHMYVGQEVQAVTIRRQVQPNQLLYSTAHLTPRRRYGRQLHCRPSRLRTRPLHAASDPRVGHQISALGVLSCSAVPNQSRALARTLNCLACAPALLAAEIAHSHGLTQIRGICLGASIHRMGVHEEEKG